MSAEKSFLRSSTPTVLNIALLLLSLLIVFSFGIRSISSDSIWTHLASGRDMAVGGGVPRVDQSSFSRPGADTVAPSWLYDRAMYALWQSAGPAGLSIAHSLAAVLAFLLLIPVARRWANFPAIAMAILLCAWLLAFRMGVSPALFAAVFPAIFLNLLYSRARPVLLWTMLPLVQWLWANMFPSFVLGPLLLLLMALQSHFVRKSDAGACYSPKTYISLAGICLLTSAINPYGLKLHAHIIELWQRPSLIYMNDWISPFAGSFNSGLSTFLLVLMLVVGAFGLITYREKLPIMLTIIVALAAFLSVRSLRFIEQLAILIFPFLCLAMQAVLNTLADLKSSFGGRGRSFADYGASALALLLAIFSLWSISSNRYYSQLGSGSAFGLGIEDSSLPVAAAQILARDDFPERAINFPDDGGYLAWALPQRRIFIDSRLPLFGIDLYQRLNTAALGDEQAWSRLEADFDFDAVILPCADNNGGVMFRSISARKNWALVYFDGLSAVFVRKLPRYATIIQDQSLREQGIALLEQEREDYAARLEAGGRLPNSARLIGAGNVFYAVGNLAAASAVFDLLQQGAPNMTGAWLISGIARARQGRDYRAAAEMLERACRLNSELALGWMWLSYCREELGDLGAALDAYERGLALDPELGNSFFRPGSRR